jgi:microcystin-dependent protein
MVGFNFAPVSWAFCNGATVPISENETLYNLIGTTYGGNGTTTFNLPNLQSRMPVHQGTATTGTSYIIGGVGGAETVTLLTNQIPSHTHAASCNATANALTPVNNYWASATPSVYSNVAPGQSMNNAAVGLAGGSQPHDNIPPFQAVNFIIALYGIYPSQG